MTDLGPYLERLGLEQYLDALVTEGFETWETVLDIQETDFDALHFKLGHRRKLQRAIAEHRGIPYEHLYGVPVYNASLEPSKPTDISSQGLSGGVSAQTSGFETKRKYRRHPKPDENAPERPPSAYVIFSNKIREEVKDQNLSFTQIAKLVGDRWQKLHPQGKEPYEAQANAAKERYNIQLSAYKKTDAYNEYTQYLAEFKAKHGGGTVGGPSEQKKPKLEGHESGSYPVGSVSEMLQSSRGHSRGGSIGSMSSAQITTTPTSPLRSQGQLPNQLQQPSSAVLPSRQASGTPRGISPPGSGRELRWRPPSGPIGHVSTQSSISEGSSNMRSDSDPLIRAASLSLSTPPTGTPPLHPQGEYKSSTDSGRPRFPGPPPSLPSYGSTTSGHSVALPSPMGSEGSWRGRPSELRGYLDAGSSSMQPPSHFPPITPITPVTTLPPLPQLPTSERSSDFLNRVLPLPRTSPTQQSGLVQPSRFPETPSGFSFNPPPHPTIRRESSGESPMARSESDAANALAGLASSTPNNPSRPGSGSLHGTHQERRWSDK